VEKAFFGMHASGAFLHEMRPPTRERLAAAVAAAAAAKLIDFPRRRLRGRRSYPSSGLSMSDGRSILSLSLAGDAYRQRKVGTLRYSVKCQDVKDAASKGKKEARESSAAAAAINQVYVM